MFCVKKTKIVFRYSIRVGHRNADTGKIDWKPTVRGEDCVTLGNYNILLKGCPAYKYADGKFF